MKKISFKAPLSSEFKEFLRLNHAHISHLNMNNGFYTISKTNVNWDLNEKENLITEKEFFATFVDIPVEKVIELSKKTKDMTLEVFLKSSIYKMNSEYKIVFFKHYINLFLEDEEDYNFLKEYFKEIPKTWKELKRITGYYILPNSSIAKTANLFTNDGNINIIPKKEQAEEILVFMQLLQLYENFIKLYPVEGGKYGFMLERNDLFILHNNVYNSYFIFNKREDVHLFVTTYKEYILKCKNLLK